MYWIRVLVPYVLFLCVPELCSRVGFVCLLLVSIACVCSFFWFRRLVPCVGTLCRSNVLDSWIGSMFSFSMSSSRLFSCVFVSCVGSVCVCFFSCFRVWVRVFGVFVD